MNLRRRAFLKYFIAAGLLLVAFFCEWFVYVIQPLFWSNLKCRQDELCTKILFVADPQIQGELAVPSPLNHLFIYDSDKYLQSTYTVVTNHFEPDVVVYLGDIMDEGSVATKEQYQRYAKRIKSIFTKTYSPVAEVWIPGDNDIGGEMEPIKKDKIEAFEREFQDASVQFTWRNILFYKVNAITNTFAKLQHNNTGFYNIVISHYSVTSKYNLRTQVMNEIHPNVFFCAHSHDSKYIKNTKDFAHRITYKLMLPEGRNENRLQWCNGDQSSCMENEILEVLPADDSLHEVYVPTCSYRMGTSKIGYGAALYVHDSRILKYTVFWSPQRFPYLFFYLAILITIVLYACVVRCCRPRPRRNIFPATGNDSIPLLNNMQSYLITD